MPAVIIGNILRAGKDQLMRFWQVEGDEALVALDEIQELPGAINIRRTPYPVSDPQAVCGCRERRFGRQFVLGGKLSIQVKAKAPALAHCGQMLPATCFELHIVGDIPAGTISSDKMEPVGVG